MSEVVENADLLETDSNEILVTTEMVRGYGVAQQEELGHTLGLLSLTQEQFKKCKDAAELEKLYDDLLSQVETMDEGFVRRICRSVTLIGILTNRPIPKRFYLIDDLVYKALGAMLQQQQTLREQLEAGELTQEQIESGEVNANYVAAPETVQ